MIRFTFAFLAMASIGGHSLTAQIIHQESFETTDGWTLSHTFDDLDDDFCKRDSATSTALPGLQYSLVGSDGFFVVAAEDTDASLAGAPADGVVTLSLDPIDISAQSDMEIVVSLSCNQGDEGYDDRSLSNGDYLDFQIQIDGDGWQTIGTFNSAAGGTSTSTLFHDLDSDGDGGEIGELPIQETMTDFEMPFSGAGAMLDVRAVFKMDGGDEEIVIDDIRLRVDDGDSTPPQVYSIAIVDNQTIEIIFSENLNVTNALQPFHYSGIPGLASVSSPSDNTILLNYSDPFDIGAEYDLVVFAIQDAAGNQQLFPFQYNFFYNPTTPDLVITEIMYNDPSDVDSLEYVEVYNNGTSVAQLGGFEFDDAISLTLPAYTEVPAGGFLLIARNAEAAEAFYNESFIDYGGQCSNNGENIILKNAEGVVIDSVLYSNNVPWPNGAGGEGPSIELANIALDNDIGSNWVAATNGIGFLDGVATFGTPGFLPTAILPVVSLDDNDIEVWESDGVIMLDLFVSAANSSSSVVALTLIGGTATLGDDHQMSSIANFTIPAGSTGEQLSFPLFEDAIDEGVEYLTYGISAVDNCITGGATEITVIIADNDHVSPTLFINELQSDNETDVMDEAMEHEDWIEIYNPNAFEVDIAGYFISDDPENITKDRLPVGDPATIIPAGGWTLLWADENGSEGPLHLGFKLSAGNGESVILTNQDSIGVIDQVDFPPLGPDVSYGRNGDGNALWVTFSTTTPNAMNLPLSLEEWKPLVGIYPNPVTNDLFLPSPMDLRLFDASGRLVEAYTNVSWLDFSNFLPGVYFVLSEDGHAARLIKR